MESRRYFCSSVVGRVRGLGGKLRVGTLAAGVAAFFLAGCGPAPKAAEAVKVAKPAAAADPALVALAPALVPEEGDRATDAEIRRCQEKVRAGLMREEWTERLGWAFVAKARESYDPGYYKLAEICALALERAKPDGAPGLLLHGYVLDNLHRFQEAEGMARRLVKTRGLSYDYALLGDVLMEQGRVVESVPFYQKAMDLRPDLHSYARGAYVRWLMGDLPGAIELMQAAVGATSPVDPASVAWTCSRLAAFDLQAGDRDAAAQACAAALKALPNYPPALLMVGRMKLAANDAAGALPSLEAAVRGNPLPDPQWALADGLRAVGRVDDAATVEANLRGRGAMTDPRTVSLFLATRGEEPALAVRLAEEELMRRQDVFTHDALAWALASAKRMPEAMAEMDRALSEGTEDARLFFHAGEIAAGNGETDVAREWVGRATKIRDTLLPSERARLAELGQRLGAGDPAQLSGPAAESKPFPVSKFIEPEKPRQKTKEKS